MKVQLQTNYAQRSITQKTSKAQTCNRPNFAGTWQVSGPKGQISPLLLRGIEIILESFKPTSIKRGEFSRIGENPTEYVKASFPQELDKKISITLRAALAKERDMDIYHLRLDSLTREELESVKVGLPLFCPCW